MLRRILLCGTVTAWLIVLCSSPARPAIITGNKNGGNPVSGVHNGKEYVVSVRPRPVQHLDGPTAEDLALLGTNAPGWLASAGAAASGTFNVLQYDPWINVNLGGADFAVLYDDGVAEARTDYAWVQIARPHNWGPFDSNPFVDSATNGSPFYSNYTPEKLPTLLTPSSGYYGPSIWLRNEYPQQKIQNPTGGGNVPAGDLIFQDEPWCELACADIDGTAWIDFHLFLATWDIQSKEDLGEVKLLTIHDGMRWGVIIAAVPEPSAFLVWILLSVCSIRIGARSVRRVA